MESRAQINSTTACLYDNSNNSCIKKASYSSVAETF